MGIKQSDLKNGYVVYYIGDNRPYFVLPWNDENDTPTIVGPDTYSTGGKELVDVVVHEPAHEAIIEMERLLLRLKKWTEDFPRSRFASEETNRLADRTLAKIEDDILDYFGR